MIIAVWLTSLLLAAAPAKNTDVIWWRTKGGMVVENRGESAHQCNLILTEHDKNITFSWQTDQPSFAALTKLDWDYKENTPMGAAVKIGDQWLGDNNTEGMIDRPALADGNMVLFLLRQPIDDLLMHADQIIVKVSDDDLAITLPDKARMAALVKATRLCRGAAHLSE